MAAGALRCAVPPLRLTVADEAQTKKRSHSGLPEGNALVRSLFVAREGRFFDYVTS